MTSSNSSHDRKPLAEAFEKLQENLGLFAQLVSGDGAESNFLLVPTGHRIKATYRDDIITAEPSPPF